jgi:hypothetical protein
MCRHEFAPRIQIEKFRESLAFLFEYLREHGMPIPLVRHRVAMVAPA